ncbi:5-dehydro-4-deoxyglucarate dehydratase [Paenibacillus doosanensis]|uniref:5-dehydro-4-deoxyglucarate dehydratase n=1 Tax=Paenibacillus doosanensis TaxID=1229154 RepID=UPI00218017A6|nr:5-dehydro-4-deoxyglucarate dehydratase [Paenibacillus doosanensis]MCS7459140.1 5-dehydro-4-deoxyglucarate dehydratase [Paenibacillus doosanensis]
MTANIGSRTAPGGILGFPVAPMDRDGRLDVNAFEHNVRFLVTEGLEAIFVACGSGEFHALSPQDYRSMVETALSVAGGKVPVYTGVGGNISQALELTRISAELGADGYLILPPYLIDAEQEGLYRYLNAIIGSTDLNAVVYQRDNCVLTLHTLERLLALPQLVGLKDGLGNMDLNIELTQTIGGRLSWLNGMPMAEVTMPAYVNLGFKAYSSAISNYIPHISRLFYNALLSGDEALLGELYRHVILPINAIRRQRKGYAVALIKAGMQIVGHPVGTEVRPPLIPVEEEHYRKLELIIKEAFERFPKPAAAPKEGSARI